MGYRIVYGKDKRRLRQFKRGGKALILSIAVCVLLFVVGCFAHNDVRLPDAALENMVESVQEGEKLSDAIVTFCREIIDNAQIPQ